MAGAFRAAPPDERRSVVLRPAVQSKLARRFDVRVTVIRAGAGFGKTTALVNAINENQLRPLGRDLWFGCSVDDASGDHLIGSIADALDVGTTPNAMDAVVEFVAASSPEQLCIALDDAHLLPPGSSGSRMLVELISRLPTNGHVVIAGRAAPLLPDHLARHEVVTIDERDLRLDAGGIDELADLLGGDGEAAAGLAGWPALVDVALRRGHPVEYLDEQVFAGMSGREQELIDVLVASGGGDVALLNRLAENVTAAELDSLPLVDRQGDRFVAHDLWVESRLGAPAIALRRVDAIRALAESWSFVRAASLLLEPIELDIAVDEQEDIWLRALTPGREPPAHVLRAWRRRLADPIADGPVGDLLAGMVRRVDHPDDECADALRSAARRFAARGVRRGEAIALSALTYPLHVAQDSAGLAEAYGRLLELSAGDVGEADHQARLAQAVLATATGDLERVPAAVTPVLEAAPDGDERTAALWLLANARNGLGEDSLDVAERLAASNTLLPGVIVAGLIARWRRGDLADLVGRAPPEANGERDRYVLAVWLSFLAAVTGDHKSRDTHLGTIRAATVDEPTPRRDGSSVMPEAIRDLEEGREDEAAGRLREFFGVHAIDGPGRGWYAMSVGLLYPHVPELREHLESRSLGPLFERDLATARAAVAVRESDAPDARRITLPGRIGEILPVLGLRVTAQLLAGASSIQVPGADALVEELTDLVGEPAAEALRAAAEHDRPLIADGARALLGRVPVRPAAWTDIRLLGSTELRRDGAVVADKEWRRERVRALLAFVLLHPAPTRETAIAALWPDAAPDAGRQNLRSTLHRLQSALEPGRPRDAAPFHVRSDGQLLRFVSGDRATVDIEQFIAACDRGRELEAGGMPSRALEHHLRAAALYRGDLLPDSYDQWILARRNDLRARFVHAAVRAGEILVALGRADEARQLMVDVLTIEPLAEAAHRTLLSAHLDLGELSAAQRAWSTCQTVLDEVGGVAEPETLVVARRLAQRSRGSADS